jgi:hypothetical protein
MYLKLDVFSANLYYKYLKLEIFSTKLYFIWLRSFGNACLDVCASAGFQVCMCVCVCVCVCVCQLADAAC